MTSTFTSPPSDFVASRRQCVAHEMVFDDVARLHTRRKLDMERLQQQQQGNKMRSFCDREMSRLLDEFNAFRSLLVMDTTFSRGSLHALRHTPSEMRKVCDEEVSLLSTVVSGGWQSSPYNTRKATLPTDPFPPEHDSSVHKQLRHLETQMNLFRGGGGQQTSLHLWTARREQRAMRFYCELFLRSTRDDVEAVGEGNRYDSVTLVMECALRSHHTWVTAMRTAFGMTFLHFWEAERGGDAFVKITDKIHGLLKERVEVREEQRKQQNEVMRRPSSSTTTITTTPAGRSILFLQRLGRGFLARRLLPLTFLRRVHRSDRATAHGLKSYLAAVMASQSELRRVCYTLETEEDRFMSQWKAWEKNMTQQFLHHTPTDPEWLSQLDKDTNATIYVNLRTGKTQKEHPNALKVVATRNRQWAKAQKMQIERRKMLEQREKELEEYIEVVLPQMEDRLM
eukprot:PhM_4_TR3471/c0_g1_i1/m.77847